MKKLFVVVSFSLAFVICAVAQKPTTAVETNNYLMGITDSIYKLGQAWGHKLSEVNETKTYAELKPVRLGIIDYIVQMQKEVPKLRNIGGSDKLQKTIIEYLAFEKSMISTVFEQFEKLPSSTSNDDLQAMLVKLSQEAKGESELLQKLGALQQEYAKKNGFTIEEPKTE